MGVTEAMDAPISAGAANNTELCWVCHPVQEQHWRALAVLLVMMATGIGLFIATGDSAWSLTGLAVLLLGLYDFLLPTTFRLTRHGVESRVLIFTRRKPWTSLRSFHVGPNGVLLSPFRGRHRMEAHRGIFVRFHGNRAEVLSIVRVRMVGDET